MYATLCNSIFNVPAILKQSINATEPFLVKKQHSDNIINVTYCRKMIEVVLRKTADKTMGISSQTQMLKLYDKFSKLTLGFIGCNPFFNMY